MEMEGLFKDVPENLLLMNLALLGNFILTASRFPPCVRKSIKRHWYKVNNKKDGGRIFKPYKTNSMAWIHLRREIVWK
jgi:hypothetical protein